MSIHPLAACMLAGAALSGASANAQSRGEQLYSTHCVSCHTTQVHWRERRLATDWKSLQAQVARWQAVESLHWSDEDIIAVTRHLNQRFYSFKAPSAPAPVAMPTGGGRP